MFFYVIFSKKTLFILMLTILYIPLPRIYYESEISYFSFIMNKNYKLFLTCIVAGMTLSANAADIRMTTSKPVGEKITLALNPGVNAVLTWDDGSTDSFLSYGTPVELTLKSQSFTLSSAENITAIYAPGNGLTSIDLSAVRSKVQKLFLADNELESMDLRTFPLLTELDVQNNKMKTLSVRGAALTYLNVASNELVNFTAMSASKLIELNLADNQLLTLPESSKLTALEQLMCQNNNISSMTMVSPVLESVVATKNELTSLTGTNTSTMRELWVGENQLEKVDVSGTASLRSLVANNNQLDSVLWSGALNPNLSYVDLSYNNLYFSSMPLVYDATRRVYTIGVHELGNQGAFKFVESVNMGEQINWSANLRTDAWGTNLTPQYTLYNSAGTKLESGVDYTETASRFVFKTPQQGVVMHVTSRRYPDIELVSRPFNVVSPTGIESVEQDATDDAWYTLQGVRVDRPTRGIYIHKGKKVMINK